MPTGLVESGGEPDRVAEPHAAEIDLERRVGHRLADPSPREREPEEGRRDAMRCLGRQREEERTADRSDTTPRAASPSIPSCHHAGHVRRRGGAPGRGFGTARRLRAVVRQALDRLLRQVPVPHPARPAQRARPCGDHAAAGGRRPSRGSRGRRDAARGRRLARDRAAGRRRSQGTEALRHHVAGRGARTRRRPGLPDRGREHDGSPGTPGSGGARRRRRLDRAHRARDRPGRRRSSAGSGLRRRGGRRAPPPGSRPGATTRPWASPNAVPAAAIAASSRASSRRCASSSCRFHDAATSSIATTRARLPATHIKTAALRWSASARGPHGDGRDPYVRYSGASAV